MEIAATTIERPNSVKIAISQKGIFSGECKVYAETIDEAMTKAKEKADELRVYIKENNGE